MLTSRRPALALLLCCMAGCALTGEKYQRPAPAVPADWQGGKARADAWPDTEWWKGFQAEELDRLIAEAQANNHDLKAAAARVREARAAAQIAGAALYPSVTLPAQISRANTTNPSNLRNSTTGSFTAYRVAPQVRYEVDLWGANHFASEAASDALVSSAYGQEVVRLTLIADVANTYFQILSLNDRLVDATRNLENARRVQDVVDAQRRAGRLSAFEVERQHTQLSTAEATVAPLQQQLQAARDALAVLLGKAPGELSITGTTLRALAVPEVPLGLPSTLLERRPDVRQAEMNLMAANADIGAARAALFPSVSLNALAGVSGPVFGANTPATSHFHAISLGVLATIFDGGRLFGQLDFAKARKLELAESYQQSILGSFRDVEDALAGVTQFAAEESAQQDAVMHAREANRLAEVLLRSGARDFTAVLDAERTVLAAETASDEARLSRFSSVVALYRALGGGWDSKAAAAGTPRKPAP